MSTQSQCAPEDSQALGFWRRPFVQDVLPLLTSFVLHLGLIILGILTYKAVTTIVAREQLPMVIPQSVSQISDLPMNFGPEGVTDGVDMATFQDQVPDAPANATGLSSKLAASLQAGGGQDSKSADEEIAVGLDKAFGKTGNGQGIGKGLGTGAGNDDGSGLAPWGPRTSLANGVPFCRLPGRANKVVFLCDASGSMMTKFDALRGELRKAIDGLRPNQQFDVIFFAADKYIALDPHLLYAVPENKRKAYELLETTAAHDTSNPIPGLNAAFATQPELIYLLTDGDFPDNNAVYQEVRKLAAGKKVAINTIAFFDRGEQYELLLKQIADQTKGSFRFVSEEDLSR